MQITKRMRSAVVLALPFMFVACSDSDQPNQADSIAQETIKKELILDVDINESTSPPELTGFTNLPDRTQLQYGIFRPDIGFFTGGAVAVINGSFTFHIKGNDGKVPPPGQYKVRVSTTMSSMQPNDVQLLVGEEYSNFTGPLIDSSGSRTNISYEVQLSMSGSISDDDLLALREKRLKELTAQVQHSCSVFTDENIRSDCIKEEVTQWRTAMGL